VQMTGLAAERRSAADLRAMDAAVERLGAALAAADARAYFTAADELSLAFARATRNPIFEMLAGWNQMVLVELESVFVMVRAPTDHHRAALALLVDRIRARDADGARKMVTAYHEWATPRLLGAAPARHADAALERVMEKLR